MAKKRDEFKERNVPQKAEAYEFCNPEKVDRALNGTLRSGGHLEGGVKKADGTWDEAELLAEYDKLGGLIKKGGDSIQTGSFYDFKNRTKREKPEIIFEFRVAGEKVLVPEGRELPGVVKGARLLEEHKKDKEDSPRRKAKAK